MTFSGHESTILDEVRRELIAEGYDVVLAPNSMLLPSFLKNYRPDAIAFRKDKNVIVEVTKSSPHADRRVKDIQALIADQPDWELRLIWIAPGATVKAVHRPSLGQIQSTLRDIEQLLLAGQNRAALLLAWASLEAVGRLLQPSNLNKPQTPARLVQQLALSGAILPDTADHISELIPKRNRLIHGELRVDVRRSEVDSLIQVVRALLEQASLPQDRH